MNICQTIKIWHRETFKKSKLFKATPTEFRTENWCEKRNLMRLSLQWIVVVPWKDAEIEPNTYRVTCVAFSSAVKSYTIGLTLS